MKKCILLILASFYFLYGCSDDDHNHDTPLITRDDLVQPEFAAVTQSNNSLFTGALDVYPCNAGTSVYYGNYFNGELSPIYALYGMSNGVVATANRPVILPTGTYNMVYWGMPKEADSIYANIAVRDPVFRLGVNLSDTYYGLRPYSSKDTLYYPVFNYVFAVVPVNIGTDKLSASLKRVVAGLVVTMKSKEGGRFNTNVDNIKVQIGGIAEKLDLYTATPINQTKTVQFSLSPSADGTKMTVPTVMLFPSTPSPLLRILITLKNGAVKTYQRNLSSPLTANTKLALTLTLNEIFSEETTSGVFEVSNWNEVYDNIDLPPIGE